MFVCVCVFEGGRRAGRVEHGECCIYYFVQATAKQHDLLQFAHLMKLGGRFVQWNNYDLSQGLPIG